MPNLSNAELAQKISNLIDKWDNREDEFRAWLSGVATGGPANDGRYPLTDFYGLTVYAKCPAKLEADVNGLVDSASAYAAAASASAASATAAASTAGTNATNAQTFQNNALSYRDQANTHRSQAATSAANAEYWATLAQNIAEAAAAAPPFFDCGLITDPTSMTFDGGFIV